MSTANSHPTIDFFGIGVAKCGTSWLYTNLAAHPEVCMSSLKETNYFGRNHFRGPAWYADRFADCTPGQVRGEFSPSYLSDDAAMQKLLVTYPDASFIVSVREPIARLRSHWQFDYGRGKHNVASFDTYAANANDAMLTLAQYGTYLDRLLTHVSREQVHIILYDDIKRHPEQILRDLYTFLAVDPDFVPPEYQKRVRVSLSSQPRIRYLNTILFRIRSYFLQTKALHGMLYLLKALRLNLLTRALLRLNTTRKKPAPTHLDDTLTPETRQKLQNYYRADIEILSQLLERDLLREWGYRE